MNPDTAPYLDFRGWYTKYLGVVGQRHATFCVVLNWIMQTGGKRLVETGSLRMDGSTRVFADFCSHTNSHLWTVDSNAEVIAACKAETAQYAEWIDYVHSDSVEFLKAYAGQIDLLYLDSLDYDPGKPHISQEHHRIEIETALPKLTARAAVLIDDNSEHGGGKGELVRPVLMANGFICLLDAYQSAWVRP